MKMKKWGFTAILLLFGFSACYAQLGTNPRGNVLAFGKPVKESVESGFLVHVFERNGLRYEIFYESDVKAVLVHIRTLPQGDTAESKGVDLSESDFNKILAQNIEQSKWTDKSAGLHAGLKLWEREDGKAFAEFDNTTGLMTVAYRSAIPKHVEVDISNWTPLQLCLSQGLSFPARQCVYGLKTGFMSGQGRVVGVEASLVSAATPEVFGVKGALVNVGNGSKGLHLGIVNLEKDFSGMQAGVVNVLSGKNPGTPPPNGFQFGLVNYARDLDGFQFGLVNIVANGSLTFMVLFNFDSPDVADQDLNSK